MDELVKLAECAEAADASQQRLLLEDAYALIYPTNYRGGRNAQSGWASNWPEFAKMLDAEAYESAALKLVPDWARVVTITEHLERDGWYVKLCVHEPHSGFPTVTASTPALAICAAALRAKAGA